MAENSSTRITELESYAQLANGVRNLRYFFYFYSFLSFAFWFLNCFELDLYWANPIFQIPYKILVALGYKIDGVAIDFSLAIIGIISLLIGGIIDFSCNKLYDKFLDEADEEERKLEMKRKKRKAIAEKNAAKRENPIDDNNPFDESKLLFIIQPHIKKIKRKETDLELTFQEVDIWRKRVNSKLLENISYSKPLQKGYYRKNLFLVYKDLYYVEDFVYYIKPTIASIINDFKKYGISISFNYVLSSISSLDALEKELDCMDTILSLDFTNEYIVTNRFKVTYENKPIRKYIMKMKGEYNLSKNLAVTNRQPLFSLVDKTEKGDNE